MIAVSVITNLPWPGDVWPDSCCFNCSGGVAARKEDHMSSSQQVPANQYRCETCGRWFDTLENLKQHEPECLGVEQSGRTGKPRATGEKDEGADRAWRPVP